MNGNEFDLQIPGRWEWIWGPIAFFTFVLPVIPFMLVAVVVKTWSWLSPC